MRLWGDIYNEIDKTKDPGGYMLEMSSLFYR